MESVHKDFIRLRNKSTDAKETGLTVHLLPDGGSAPGGLIALTQDPGNNWQYNFPVSIVNGKHTLYINSTPAQNNGVDIDIQVYRTGYPKAW